MAQQTINVGTAPNDGTGTPLRTAFQYTNSNFSELYTAVGPSGNNIVVPGNATITGDLTVDTSTLKVDSANNRVGVGTASPQTTLDSAGTVTISGGTGAARRLNFDASGVYLNYIESAGTAGAGYMVFAAGNSEVYRIATGGTSTWSVGGTTAMTLNSTGLGVGGSPSYKLSSIGTTNNQVVLHVGNTAGTVDGDTTNVVRFAAGSGANALWANARYDGFSHAWRCNSTTTQAMTLDASGNLLVGTTTAAAKITALAGASGQAAIFQQPAQNFWCVLAHNQATSGDNSFVLFGTEASFTSRGSISYNRAGGLVAYNTTSDYRAKDIIGPVSNSGSLIDSLKVYVGKMKGATIERPMLIAHEAQEVAPYAVTGTKDEVDADGKPKYQQMDASALVPLLIAEIQSLRARVQTLETR